MDPRGIKGKRSVWLVPENDLTPQLLALYGCNAEIYDRWNRPSTWFQKSCSRICKILNDSSIESETTYLVRDYHIDSLRKLHPPRKTFHKPDCLCEPVRFSNLASQADYRSLLNGVDTPGSCPASYHSKNAGSRTQIQHNIARFHNFSNRPSEGINPADIRQILAMFVNYDRHFRSPVKPF
jgi:hypothetical protein